MPMHAPRPCLGAGCRFTTLSPDGLCEAHRRSRDHRRGSAASRGYGPQHRAWRLAVLAKSDGLCVACLAVGRVTPARVADHVVPRSMGGGQFDLDNGQALCDGVTGLGCHDLKRAAESRGQRMIVVEGQGLVVA